MLSRIIENMVAASLISTINVERPEAKSSDAPIRVKDLDQPGPITRFFSGHKAADMGQ